MKEEKIEEASKKVGSKIKSYFFTGIVVTAPVAITVYMSYHLLIWINDVTSRLVPKQWSIGDFVPYAVPGAGLLLFLGGFVIATVVEYLIGLILEKLFHATWWDYSQKPFNIKGLFF